MANWMASFAWLPWTGSFMSARKDQPWLMSLKHFLKHLSKKGLCDMASQTGSMGGSLPAVRNICGEVIFSQSSGDKKLGWMPTPALISSEVEESTAIFPPQQNPNTPMLLAPFP
eukprot:CAMPEP_0197481082 /NCGR_PEP_ID=MMETSP1309-20131121/45024_1 /TAXON_ID=464262 /ORGANISM="Genus nov. species nov., Strain RCC998" /LENGTH=113 /DNA_ID=CAMNT_0043023217 /DNA_START=60 /DNA_END=401 /DNA_ORIENTATION=+